MAPTPAPYRAFEYDYVQQQLREEYSFHALFLQQSWSAMQWENDLPKLTSWEVLPQSRLAKVFGDKGKIRRFNKGTIKILNSINPHAIVLQGYDAPALWQAYRWGIKKRRALLFRCDSNIAKERVAKAHSLKMVTKKKFLKGFFKRISAFLTIGTANEEYLSFYGADPKRYFRTNFAFDSENISHLAQQERQNGKPWKKDFGIKAETVVLFVGRLIQRKGIEGLIEAFKSIQSEFDDIAFLIVGDGPLKILIEQQIAGVRNIHLAGFRQPDEIARIYGCCNLMVVPSWEEPWGFVVCEALASGLPVIATNTVGAARDLVIPQETGDLVPCNDVAALKESLRNLLRKKDLEQMGKNGQTRLMNWQRDYNVATQYQKALDYVLSNQKN